MKSRALPISVSLIIPVYNNEQTVVAEVTRCVTVVRKVSRKFEIVISDDKSTDSTKTLLKKYFANKNFMRIYFQKKNLGISKNIKFIYDCAHYEYVALFSVDGDWTAKDLGKLIRASYESNADIVVGVRNKKTYSSYRKVISFFYNLLPLLFFGVKTVDAGSIKVVRKDIIKKFSVTSKSIFFEAELLIRAKRAGKKIVFVPIRFKKMKKNVGGGGKIVLVLHSFFDLIKLRLTI